MTPFGARLRALRRAAGLSQVDLAERLGVSHTYVSKLEHGAIEAPGERLLLAMESTLGAEDGELCELAGKIPRVVLARRLAACESEVEQLRAAPRPESIPTALWAEADRCARLMDSTAERKALKACRDIVKRVYRAEGRDYLTCPECRGLAVETEGPGGAYRCLECSAAVEMDDDA